MKKVISRILIFSILHLCWLTSYGWAEMVTTQSAIRAPTNAQKDRQHLLDLLNRQEVADELKKNGILPAEATARVNSLSGDEVTRILGRLEGLPAGGEHSLTEGHEDNGAAVGILIILLILLFIVLFWDKIKASSHSPSASDGTYSEPTVEDCDLGMESCV